MVATPAPAPPPGGGASPPPPPPPPREPLLKYVCETSLRRSFGGFGALTRHLGRLTDGVCEAVEADLLDESSLALIAAYNPGGWGVGAGWWLEGQERRSR